MIPLLPPSLPFSPPFLPSKHFTGHPPGPGTMLGMVSNTSYRVPALSPSRWRWKGRRSTHPVRGGMVQNCIHLAALPNSRTGRAGGLWLLGDVYTRCHTEKLCQAGRTPGKGTDSPVAMRPGCGVRQAWIESYFLTVWLSHVPPPPQGCQGMGGRAWPTASSAHHALPLPHCLHQGPTQNLQLNSKQQLREQGARSESGWWREAYCR